MIHAALALTAVVEHREAAAPSPAHVTVRSGDTLSGIAERYHIQWPGLYEANRHEVGADPNALRAGERLRIPTAAAAARMASKYTEAAPKPQASSSWSTASDTSQSTYWEPSYATDSYSAPSGSFQSCVIAAESGGDSQVMNATGHYGLYQFSYSTWVANGGSGSEFGNASVSEQNQVFNNTVASSGESAWAPYDGC